MQLRLAAGLLSLAACGTSYTLDEDEGITIAHDVFATHDIFVGSTRPMGPVRVDDRDPMVQFTVDRWSLADGVGFEYVSDDDPDFATAVGDLGSSGGAALLQVGVDAFLELEEGDHHILIIRTWGHETAELAQGQLET